VKRLALFACALIAVAAPGRAQSRQSVDALETWINAVKAHQPGTADRPVAFVGALKYSDRVILNPAMTVFLAAVRAGSTIARSDQQNRIVDLARAVRNNPGFSAFLRRAALLHTDAAIFRDRQPDFQDDAPPPDVKSRTSASPLLANDLAIVHTDGRVVGQTALNWNWTFARALLDVLVHPDSSSGSLATSDIGATAERPFVAAWYHATSAYLLAIGKHGDLKGHLAHVAAVLPEDAHVLFDRACSAETLGLPVYQALPSDAGYGSAATRIRIVVAPENKTDEEAETLFRRAIEVDPTYAEARVRLARLLERRGLHEEAAAQIEQALAAAPDATVAYFAHIVAGRNELARGRTADAFAHYRAALAIFPDAQSALLGASQAAVMSSDVPGALALVQKLGDRTAVFEADPWWNYLLGAGRDVRDLMAAVWARVPQ
jgi:tetratricopeptide (TPR) repeat protein